jgi:hypothetical protein
MKPPRCPRCTCPEVIIRKFYQTPAPVKPEGDLAAGAKPEPLAPFTTFRCRYCGHEWSAG